MLSVPVHPVDWVIVFVICSCLVAESNRAVTTRVSTIPAPVPVSVYDVGYVRQTEATGVVGDAGLLVGVVGDPVLGVDEQLADIVAIAMGPVKRRSSRMRRETAIVPLAGRES